MRLGAILLIFLMANVFPHPVFARASGGSNAPEATARSQQAPSPPGLQHNVGTLAEMMRDIHRMLHSGPLTPKQAEQVSDIMTRLGVMMKEMSGPQAERFQSQHQRQLQEMKMQLEEIKAQIKSQKR